MQESKLLTGNITKSLLVFALPMIAGNLLQQFYNIADTIIVGRFLGADALAADISYFHHPGPVYGQRRFLFHQLWKTG